MTQGRPRVSLARVLLLCPAAVHSAAAAKVFIDTFEVDKADLSVVRNEMVGWILELSSAANNGEKKQQ